MATFAERLARANTVSSPMVQWAIMSEWSDEDVARVSVLSDACARGAIDEARVVWAAISGGVTAATRVEIFMSLIVELASTGRVPALEWALLQIARAGPHETRFVGLGGFLGLAPCALLSAAAHGQLEVLRWLDAHVRVRGGAHDGGGAGGGGGTEPRFDAIKVREAFSMAAANGYLAVLEWFAPVPSETLLAALRRAHESERRLEVARWLVEAAERYEGPEGGKPEAARALSEGLRDLLESSIVCDRLELTQWLWERLNTGGEWPLEGRDLVRLLYRAVGVGATPATLEWLWARCRAAGRPLDVAANNSLVFRKALEAGAVHMLEWLWRLRTEHGEPLDPAAQGQRLVISAAESNKPCSLDWLLRLRDERGVPVDFEADDPLAFEEAVEFNAEDTARWLWEHGFAPEDRVRELAESSESPPWVRTLLDARPAPATDT